MNILSDKDIKLNYWVSRIPVIIASLIATLNVTLICTEIDLEAVSINGYALVVETINCPLVLTLYMLIVSIRLKLCWFPFVSIFGLFGLNVVNLLKISPIIDDYSIYTSITIHILFVLTTLLSILLLIRKT